MLSSWELQEVFPQVGMEWEWGSLNGTLLFSMSAKAVLSPLLFSVDGISRHQPLPTTFIHILTPISM